MPKECAQIAIINMEELKNLGCVPMINYMPVDCARIAILINTTK